jgi:hypothetical protein
MMVCPDCGRRGVYTRMGGGDVYVCRFGYLGCQFYAYQGGTMAHDVDGRSRLAGANPAANICVRGYFSYDN